MNTQLVRHHDIGYVEGLPSNGFLDGEAEALEMVTACFEGKTQNLLIDGHILTEAFYHLRTGLAGAILQKFCTYKIRAALILAEGKDTPGRFGEMVWEANRGNQFRVFYSREEAEGWFSAMTK